MAPDQGAATRRYDCGITVISGEDCRIDSFAATVSAAAKAEAFSVLIVYFSPKTDPHLLAKTLRENVDVDVQIGCSTAGEIGPGGYSEESAVAILLPARHFRAASGIVTDISSGGLDRGAECATHLTGQLQLSVPDEIDGQRFALSLIDGLSQSEELIISAFDAVLGDIPRVGGSAGDGLDFEETWVLHDGDAHRDTALLCLLHTDLPFEIFKSDNFRPTDVRLVVTGCDSDRRLVTELNGLPAVEEFSKVVGIDQHSLNPMSFAAFPVVVRIGGEHYCRSIRRMEGDGLSFFCAIDEGVVLTLAERDDITTTASGVLSGLDQRLGGIDIVLGFDCILRRLDAESRQSLQDLSGVYKDYNVVGFSTYGEHFMSMHINQTLTGIAFGRHAEGRSEALGAA